MSEDGRVFGTYIHGIFEEPGACAALLRWAGLRAPREINYQAVREEAIERLADTVEGHLNMTRILSWIQ
jgi:adenosylcobyric acid synthase